MFAHVVLRKIVVTLVFALEASAFSQTEKALYTFSGGSDGSRPLGPLVADSAGNLYGATIQGGSAGGGVVFKLTRSGGGWVETVLHDFTGIPDGFEPQTPLVLDAKGNVYGATSFGGSSGGGTIFELSPSGDGWTETVLFNLGEDGATIPIAGLAADAAGNLFGTTSLADESSGGAVFELSPSAEGDWSFTILHVFTGDGDGAEPYGTVILDPFGNLYGTTWLGGLDWGTVYEIARTSSGWNESVIYSFRAGNDGESPLGNLMLSPTGHLYGTTIAGGTAGQGTAFELTPISGHWSERIIHSFGSYAGDSIDPDGALVMDQRGNLYGATASGGSLKNGAVFELRPSGTNWHEKLLYSFVRPRNADSRYIDNVILDTAGNLYGVAAISGAKGSGIVFEIIP